MCGFAVPKETPTIKYSTHRQNPAHAVHISSISCVFVLLARHSTIIVNNPYIYNEFNQWLNLVGASVVYKMRREKLAQPTIESG